MDILGLLAVSVVEENSYQQNFTRTISTLFHNSTIPTFIAYRTNSTILLNPSFFKIFNL